MKSGTHLPEEAKYFSGAGGRPKWREVVKNLQQDINIKKKLPHLVVDLSRRDGHDHHLQQHVDEAKRVDDPERRGAHDSSNQKVKVKQAKFFKLATSCVCACVCLACGERERERETARERERERPRQIAYFQKASPEHDVVIIWVHDDVEEEAEQRHVRHVRVGDVVLEVLIDLLDEFAAFLVHDAELLDVVCEGSVLADLHSASKVCSAKVKKANNDSLVVVVGCNLTLVGENLLLGRFFQKSVKRMIPPSSPS